MEPANRSNDPAILSLEILDKHFYSVALIQRLIDSRSRYLLKWNASSLSWRFCVGERLHRESFREAAIREVSWQLQLDRNKDFLVSQMAQLSVELHEVIEEHHESVHLAVAFYPVHLFRKEVVERLSIDPSFGWFSSQEVWNGRSNELQTIDPLVSRWLRRWLVIHPWP